MRSKRKAGKAVFTADRGALPAAGLALLAGLAGCASVDGPRSASGTRIDPAALVQASEKVRSRAIPEPLQADFTALYSEGRQNSVLHAMRAGLRAFRLGHDDLACEAWDQAIQEIEALQAGAAQAERTRSKFVADREKWFKGENYERSALYFYRGLLYLHAQDFGNAAACFKRAQVEDITGDDAPGFAGDWFSAEWALALASLKQGFPEDAAAARQRAASFVHRPDPVSWPGADADTLVVLEAGTGPQKNRQGRFGEKLIFQRRPTKVAAVEASGQRGPALETLHTQATTRGTRVLDHILAGKASFKEDTANATLGLGAGAVVAAQTRTEEGAIAAGVLGLAAIGTAIASGATQPEADIRAWDILPDQIFLLALRTEGRAFTVQALDAAGGVVNRTEIAGVPSGETLPALRVVRIRLTD